MIQLFRALADRVKALFVTHAALDFEAEFLARDAERKADLLRQALRYDDEGLHGIAEQLRQQAEALTFQRPLASVLPSVQHLLGEPATAPLLPNVADDMPAVAPKPSLLNRKKKGR